MKKPSDRPALTDCALLFGIEILSTMPYLFGLGFYSDDWDTQAKFAHLSGQGLGTIIGEGFQSSPEMLVRPVTIVYGAAELKAFGQHPIPYHIVNSVVFGIVVVLLYLALRELRIGRWLALAISVIFGLLPHYSTDRVWITSHQTTLSMAFAFLGIYAMLRATRPEQQSHRRWVVVAVVALLLSMLSYEVAIGLIVASVGVAAWRRYAVVRASSQRAFAKWGGLAIATGILLAVGILKTRLQTRMPYHHHFFTHLGALTWHAIDQAIRFNFWTYSLHMPAVLGALYHKSALTLTAFGMAVVIACLVGSYLWRGMESSSIPTRRTCLWLIVLGFVLFGLGFALFFPGLEVDFSSAGLSNRVEIVSALGASCTLVAMVGLACSVLKSQSVRVRAFSLAIGLICGMNSLVVSGIGFFWVDAASQQSTILKSVVTNVRSLPHGSVLLLDGFCRYSGPGVVFETGWDATGAIQLALADFSLSSDVVSPNMHFHDAAAESTMYGQPWGQYAYGNNLFVYNMRRQVLTSLPSRESANAYLGEMNPTGDGGCPAGKEGDGTKVF